MTSQIMFLLVAEQAHGLTQEGGRDGAEAVPLLGAAGCRLVPGRQHPGSLPW